MSGVLVCTSLRTASLSVFGVLVSFSIDHVRLLSRVDLQVTLLVALLVPAVIAFLRPPHREAPVRRQLLAIGVPFVAIAAFLGVMPVQLSPRGRAR